MKKIMNWTLAAILICGATVVLTSCVAENDNPAPKSLEEELKAQYHENKKITNGNYDKSLAVKCINGTFVGKKTENIVAYKGIPYVGMQPVGGLRWKAPVDIVPDDGVYEAYYNAKSARQIVSDTEHASLYVQGEDCLFLNVWRSDEASAERKPVIVWIHGGADISPDGKAKEWPLYDLDNKEWMIFDEFDIHPEKESNKKILDWDRTYFLTKYYCI